jgi:hypothetical protein
MNSENIQNITNQAIEQLIETQKAEKSEALTNYLAAVAKFHRYSFQNILLIARQCPQATRVAGFHTWRSLGRFVKKCEKGLMILAPLVRKVEFSDACSTEKESWIFGFRAVYVFDVSQTDGAPLPTIGVAQGEPGEYFSRLETLVREQGISLEYSAEIAPAKGMSCGKKIILLRRMAPAEQFSTLVHELAHEMLHRDALANDAARARNWGWGRCIRCEPGKSGLIQILQPRTTSRSTLAMRRCCWKARNTSSKPRIRFSIPSARGIPPRLAN